MYKAIIFDLDGTLVNTLEDLMHAINNALAIKGYPFKYSLEETKRLIGSGTKVLCQRAIASINPTEEMWMSLFNEFSLQYKIHQLDHAHLYDGVLETLKYIKDEGIKVAILSNKVDNNTKLIVNALFEGFQFDYILGQLDNMPLKPDPTGLNRVIKALNVDRKEVLYVGDSDTDMKTGLNGNVDRVAVTYGYRDIDVLEEYSPEYMINSFKELIKIL